jgi:hypothetical protein
VRPLQIVACEGEVGMEDTAVSMWAIATIGGPIVLGLAVAYSVIRNRRRRRALETRRGERN